ncbi:hypothetical protein [Taibaiella soli]|nr:hypothetical protein [Taibaiella soli]
MKRTFIVNAALAGIILLFSLFSSNGGRNDITIAMGIGLLLLALLNIFAGVVTLLAAIADSKGPAKHYGSAMLMVAGILLLCSLTFCSTSSFSM